MAKNPYRGWKIRGPWGGKETKLVLVKGSKTALINVRQANLEKGKWTFTTLDGVKWTLPKEKNKIKYLRDPDIASNCFIAYDGITYDKVGGDYTKLELAKTEYRLVFKKWYFLKKKFHMSSPICKIWKEQGKYHAITMSGAHYTFRIK